MDFFETVKRRCSTRDFSSTPIAESVLMKIVDSGRLAPTARKEEPWEFIVIAARQGLAGIAQFTDYGKFIANGAACIAVICKDTKYYLEDGCAATENILLAATDLGIGSCWVAGDKKPYADAILKFLGVPTGYKLVSLIALGYPAQNFTPAKKRPLGEVFHRDKFEMK